MTFPDATLVVLAGGAGRRLGRGEKALVPLAGRHMIDWVLDLAPAFAATVLVAAEVRPGLAALGVPMVTDRLPGRGAPGGVDAGLAAARTTWAFVVACDMPRVDPRALAFLWTERGDVDAVVASAGGRLHPLHAFYRVEPVSAAAFAAAGRGGSLHDVLGGVRTRAVELGELGHSALNVNTPEELAAVEVEMEAR